MCQICQCRYATLYPILGSPCCFELRAVDILVSVAKADMKESSLMKRTSVCMPTARRKPHTRSYSGSAYLTLLGRTHEDQTNDQINAYPILSHAEHFEGGMQQKGTPAKVPCLAVSQPAGLEGGA